ncbi:MAG: hypothetical protein NTZ05_14150, partial [Chloroflexi bacterium]|nr:hypothetical protein [Chloroflexota bacterium]
SAFGENTAAPPWLAFLKWYHVGKPALTWARPSDVSDAELFPSGRVSNQLRQQQQLFQSELQQRRRQLPNDGRTAPDLTPADPPTRERFRTLPRPRTLRPRFVPD